MTSPVHPWQCFGRGDRPGRGGGGGDPGRDRYAKLAVKNLEDALGDGELRGRLVRLLRSALGGEFIHDVIDTVLHEVGQSLISHHLILARQTGETHRVYPVNAMRGEEMDRLADAIYERVFDDIRELIREESGSKGRKAKSR